MLTATGNINQPYEVLGVVNAVVTRSPGKGGCGAASGLPVQEAYEGVTKALATAAKKSGGDGVIHIGYDYRITTKSVGCNNTEAVFEIYGWGAAVKLLSCE